MSRFNESRVKFVGSSLNKTPCWAGKRQTEGFVGISWRFSFRPVALTRWSPNTEYFQNTRLVTNTLKTHSTAEKRLVHTVFVDSANIECSRLNVRPMIHVRRRAYSSVFRHRTLCRRFVLKWFNRKREINNCYRSGMCVDEKKTNSTTHTCTSRYYTHHMRLSHYGQRIRYFRIEYFYSPIDYRRNTSVLSEYSAYAILLLGFDRVSWY